MGLGLVVEMFLTFMWYEHMRKLCVSESSELSLPCTTKEDTMAINWNLSVLAYLKRV